MYKNYELSSMAKALVKELQKVGTPVDHAKALEIAARMVGSRTLHVQQAADKPSQTLKERAWAHVERELFHNVGAWSGRLPELKAELDKIVAPDFRDLSKSEQDAKALRAWEGPLKGVQLTHLTAGLPVGDLPKTMLGEFDKALGTLKGLAQEQARVARAKSLEVARAAASLARQAKTAEEAAAAVEQVFGVSSKKVTGEVLYQGIMKDWAADEGAEDLTPAQQEATFEVRVTRQGSQLAVDIAPPYAKPDELEKDSQLALLVEVNQGKPCVHLSNALGGDTVLSIFATKDGLYLAPGDSIWEIRAGTPRGAALREIDTWQHEAGTARYNAFIEAPLS